jgi:hypothetical protein
MIHELKTWPEYFAAIVSGRKTFELRRNDRAFRENDTLHLREYEPVNRRYTGRELHRVVTYMLATDMSGDFVVMALGAPPSSHAEILSPASGKAEPNQDDQARQSSSEKPLLDEIERLRDWNAALARQRDEAVEKGATDPARLTPLESGKAIGSANKQP